MTTERLDGYHLKRLRLIIGFDILIEGDFQLEYHVLIRAVIENIQAVSQIFWICISESSKQPIPQRKYVAEILICERPFEMMMNLMHVGRYKNPADWLV